MDVHVPFAITQGLRDRGVDVLTAQEDGSRELPDLELLYRAGVLGRVLFSQDTDLLREANQLLRDGNEFGGLIYAHQLHITIGQAIRDLDLLANASEPTEMLNCVVYLPL